MLAARRALHPAHGGRAAAGGAQRAVEPVGQRLQPAHHAAELLEELPAPLGLLRLSQAIGDGLHRLPQRAERAERGVELEAEAFAPDRIGGEVVVQAQLAAGMLLQPLVEPQEQRFGGAAGIAERGQQPLRAADRGWRGSAGRCGSCSSWASVGARPRPFRSKRPSSRRTARLVTWMPR